ncbi:MAG: head GIN domain-containing protein [Chitinophagaceae bacterium]
MKKIVVFALVSFSLISSCRFMGGKRVQGNSNIQTQERNVSSFDRVEVRGSIKVNVSQGDEKKVMIEADENLISYIETIIDGDRLIIRSKEGYNLDPTGDMRVYITAPLFKSIEVSGACDIIGQTRINNSEKMKLHVSGAGEIKMEVDAPALEAEISGSGSVNLKGETKNFDLELSGAANAHCFDLLSENTKVVISGAGDAEVYASVKLDARVSGAGEIKYKGDAKDIKQSVSGAGSVKKM